MSSTEYNQLLKFLYFEGYADSYEEAEYILESMTDEEFEEVLEAYKEPDLEKMKRQEYRHTKKATSQSRGSRGSAKNRSFKMATIRGSLERGEDPRRDTFGGVRASNPEDHRAAYTKNPMNNPPRRVKEPGVKKEETEMQEAWYSGKGTYRTTASGRKVRWDEDEATDTAVSDMLQKRREAAARKAAQERMKSKGTAPKKSGKEMFEEDSKKMEGEDPCWDTHKMVGTKKKNGKEVPNCVPKEDFEAVAEYLFVEGYADTIESAELMAECISEDWVNEILFEREDSPYERASDAALDARYKYGRATGNKRSFGRAANRASAAAMLRRLRKDEREGRETSRESGADAVHQGWAHTAKTSTDQTPEKKERRAKLANTPYSQLPDDEKEKDRVSADAVRAVYNRNKKG